MKHFIYCFFILSLLACKEAKKNSEITEKSDSTQKDIKDKVIVEEKSKPLFVEFRANTWYKGTIQEIPIWMYITYSESKNISAWYGYNSTNGAFIKVSGSLENNDLILSSFLPQEVQKEEKFIGKIDSRTGKITGKWSMDKKTLPFVLEPANSDIPTNSQEFLNAFADIKVPLETITSSFSTPTEKLIKTAFKDKKICRFIPNLEDFLQGSELKLDDKQGVLMGKLKLSNGNYLALFTCNLAKEQSFEIDSYQVETKEMVCGAILDKEGKILTSKVLGNNGEDPYYMDFSLEIPSPDQINMTWTFYMRGDGGARMEESSKKETILIRNNQFERKN